jgi:gluconokinase
MTVPMISPTEGQNDLTEVEQPIVLVVMGVSGTGKSTVAGMLAGRLGWDLEEGDDLHPAANVAKMAAGQPLTDDDRWPWLAQISAWIQVHTQSGTPGVITCSALRRVYRDRLAGPGVVFVHLAGTREQIAARLSARLDHFMPPALLGSQLNTLEPLEPDENGIVVDLGHKPTHEVKEIMRKLHLLAVDYPPDDSDPG